MGKERAIDWLPADQNDVERARALIDRPVADLEPVLPRLVPWLRHDGWPVAPPVAASLRKAGRAAVPVVSRVLRGKDAVLKRNLIRHVVSTWPREDVAAICTPLGMLVSDSQSWGADLEALEVLLRHSLIDRDAASQWIAFKRRRYAEFSEQLDQLTRLLGVEGPMKVTVLPDILGGLAFVVVLGAGLFACAGRWDLPWFWAYLGVWSASALVGPLVVDPALVKERVRPGPGGKDCLFTLLFIPLGASQFIVAALDVGRFHWSDSVPPALQLAGLPSVGAALAVTVWAMAVNRFFSSVIRIQTERGHHLVTGGPYGWVRHPAYAAAPLLFLGTGLVLGSWLATLIGLLLIAAVLRRTVKEDRVLCQELEGYAAYAAKVRYRLFPGVW